MLYTSPHPEIHPSQSHTKCSSTSVYDVQFLVIAFCTQYILDTLQSKYHKNILSCWISSIDNLGIFTFCYCPLFHEWHTYIYGIFGISCYWGKLLASTLLWFTSLEKLCKCQHIPLDKTCAGLTLGLLSLKVWKSEKV